MWARRVRPWKKGTLNGVIIKGKEKGRIVDDREERKDLLF